MTKMAAMPLYGKNLKDLLSNQNVIIWYWSNDQLVTKMTFMLLYGKNHKNLFLWNQDRFPGTLVFSTGTGAHHSLFK